MSDMTSTIRTSPRWWLRLRLRKVLERAGYRVPPRKFEQLLDTIAGRDVSANDLTRAFVDLGGRSAEKAEAVAERVAVSVVPFWRRHQLYKLRRDYHLQQSHYLAY